MAIYEKEARFKLGPFGVGNKLVREVKSGFGIDKRSRRVIQTASVGGPDTVRYRKDVYPPDPEDTEPYDWASTERVLTRGQINRDGFVNKRLRWVPS